MSGIGYPHGSRQSKAEPAIGDGLGYEPPPQPVATDGPRWEGGTFVMGPTPAPGAEPARPDPPRLLTDEDLHRFWHDRIVEPAPSLFADQVADPFHYLHGSTNTFSMLALCRRTGAMPAPLVDFMFTEMRPREILAALVKLAVETPSVRNCLDGYLSDQIVVLERAREIQRKTMEQAAQGE